MTVLMRRAAVAQIAPHDEALCNTVKDHNIYRWAGNLIAELCEIRPAAPPPVEKELMHAGAST